MEVFGGEECEEVTQGKGQQELGGVCLRLADPVEYNRWIEHRFSEGGYLYAIDVVHLESMASKGKGRRLRKMGDWCRGAAGIRPSTYIS